MPASRWRTTFKQTSLNIAESVDETALEAAIGKPSLGSAGGWNFRKQPDFPERYKISAS